jgi:YD repeat-containing protein
VKLEDGGWLVTDRRDVDPVLGKTRQLFDSCLVRGIDPWGIGNPLKEFEYDVLGRLKFEWAWDGRGTRVKVRELEYLYESFPSRIRETTYPRGQGHTTAPGVRIVAYDGLGRKWWTQTQETAGGWIGKDKDYDDLGNVWKVHMAFRVLSVGPSRFTTQLYDGSGRVIEMTNPDGSKRTFQYTIDVASGHTLATTTDETLRQTRTVTDAHGRTVQTSWWDERGRTWVPMTYLHDRLSRVRRCIDAGNHAKDLYYGDSLLTAVVDFRSPNGPESYPAGRTWEFDYTLGGQLAERRNPTGRRARYVYDVAERLTQVAANGAALVEITYDELRRLPRRWEFSLQPTIVVVSAPGKMVFRSSPAGQEKFHYDKAGRVDQKYTSRRNLSGSSPREFVTGY